MKPIIFSADMARAILDGRKTQTRRIVKPQPIDGYAPDSSWIRPFAKGQRLWVRENWAWYPLDHDPSCVIYRADYAPDAPAPAEFGKWLPSIHMPRWASRITLEVTDVRAEKLQEISEQDALSEGIESAGGFFGCQCWRDYMEPNPELSSFPDDPVGSFASLWESIHGPESWNRNPWVWAIEFRRVQT